METLAKTAQASVAEYNQRHWEASPQKVRALLSPATFVWAVARNSSDALSSADFSLIYQGLVATPTFFWFQVATTME
jgi:hypothetical protein